MRRTIIVATFALAGCTDDPVIEPGFTLARLSRCEDVQARIRAQTRGAMERQLKQNLAHALQWQCEGRGGYGTEAGDAAGGGGGPAPPPSEPGAPSQSSGTNNQVAGVDEADFVKNEAGVLYIANAGKLRIIDAWPVDQAHVVSETAIEGEVKKLFVHEGRAVVYSSLVPAGAHPRGRDCTYGYSCSFTGDGFPTKLTVLDLANLAAPAVAREIRLSGSLIGARRIGASVHTVVADAPPRVENIQTWPTDLSACADPATKIRRFHELLEDNLERIADSHVEDWLPSGTDSATGELGRDCSMFYGADLGDGSAVTSVMSLDLSSATGASSYTSIVSRPGAIYGSEAALYMAVPGDPSAIATERTAIHKFGLSADPIGAEYRGSGRVSGHVLSQFAMDEFDGAFRVATTTGHVPDPKVHSTLTILREAPGGLEQVGLIDNIAPGEDIRSVRFSGRRGFVVTFKKTDPLYVFDLDPPEAPRILAELKIPGFSTYMHMLDDTHLLTIGYDASDQGSFAWFTGMMLQIFDVTDPTRPALTHKHVIGTRGSSSEALTNHLAFTYFEPKHALALPMTICEGGQPPSYGQMTFSGLVVFDATASTGFAERGRVAYPPAAGVSCSNWWTDAKSQVRRSVFMDDYVYSITGSTVKANALSNLSADLATLSIAN
jgi:hypothetical protein